MKFPAWGFGTSSQVTVRLPSGYEANAEGDTMLASADAASVVLTSDPIPDPQRWLALITAILPRDHVTQSESVPLSSGTVDLQVRAWSDDPAWGEQTLSLLVEALPMLEEAIGLPYPRVGPLVLSEAAGGESSTGPLPSSDAEIQVAFDRSPFTLLHQAAQSGSAISWPPIAGCGKAWPLTTRRSLRRSSPSSLPTIPPRCERAGGGRRAPYRLGRRAGPSADRMVTPRPGPSLSRSPARWGSLA